MYGMYFLFWLLGVFSGISILVLICCVIASKENEEPKDKDEWRGLP